MTQPRRLFALDEGFPQPIVQALSQYMTEASLVPIVQIDHRLRNVDDWKILAALHADTKRRWDGLITTDAGMLKLPREMSVLLQTKLTLVVAESAGHDPLKATGLLLAHLPHICKATRPDEAQLWILRTTQKPADDPWERLEKIAKNEGTDTRKLFERSKISEAQLGSPDLDRDDD